MTTRHMWAVVCDDIRQEVGNKQSHMGIYTGEILLPTLPLTMPKLCVVLNVRTLSTDPFKRLIVRVLKDDAELATIEVPEDQLAAIAAQSKMSEEEAYISTGFVFQFLAFAVEQPCTLRFRAETERETLKGGSTKIKQLSMGVVDVEQKH
jgi:hypothetical protein